MAERSNAAVSKTVVLQSWDRGFESPSLRNDKLLPSRSFAGRDFCFSEGLEMLASTRTYEIQKPNLLRKLGVICRCWDLPQWGSPKVILPPGIMGLAHNPSPINARKSPYFTDYTSPQAPVYHQSHQPHIAVVFAGRFLLNDG